jgi:hypothetical protein
MLGYPCFRRLGIGLLGPRSDDSPSTEQKVIPTRISAVGIAPTTFLQTKKKSCFRKTFFSVLVPEGDSTAPYNLWSSERLSVKGYKWGYNASPAGYPMVHEIALEGNAELSTTMNYSTFPDPSRSVHLYGNLGKEQRN